MRRSGSLIAGLGVAFIIVGLLDSSLDSSLLFAAGGIMVALIALFPPYIMWAPNAIWKTFDLFVGLIQAFIFALLTILYFSQSMELDEEHH